MVKLAYPNGEDAASARASSFYPFACEFSPGISHLQSCDLAFLNHAINAGAQLQAVSSSSVRRSRSAKERRRGRGCHDG